MPLFKANLINSILKEKEEQLKVYTEELRKYANVN